MKKRLLITALLLLNATAMPISLAKDSEFQKRLGMFKVAYECLKPDVKDIMVRSKWVDRNPFGCFNCKDTSIEYSYDFKTGEAAQSFNSYKKQYDKLSDKLFKNALGDGFILGTVSACLNKICGGETDNEIAIISAVLAAISMITYQNHLVGTVPYYDLTTLDKKDNLFANISFATIGRTCLTLASATASYLGTSYTWDKVSEQFRN